MTSGLLDPIRRPVLDLGLPAVVMTDHLAGLRRLFCRPMLVTQVRLVEHALTDQAPDDPQQGDIRLPGGSVPKL